MDTLQTLENISTETLLDVFNLSFSDYIVPFCLTKEQLEDKIKSDGIDLSLSVGAFENDALIAFILHGYDVIDQVKYAYNAGTGVIPSKRGAKLTTKLYESILPLFRKKGIGHVLLEVITTNEPAVKTYQNIGFKIIRKLNCFKGLIVATDINRPFEIRELEAYDWPKLSSFWDLKPSWQNSITALEKLQQTTVAIGVYEDEKLLGYAVYNPSLKRIHQLSVDKNYRRRGIGRQLLYEISSRYGEAVSAINVDQNSEETVAFLKAMGMEIYVQQYEMKLLVN